MSRPLFSIITGTYNRERYIEETIAGVLGQTCADFEWLVVDDASTDRTVELLRAVDDPRLKLEVLPENSRRPAVPRNVALRKATGRYIAFHDSDDLWLPDKLEKQRAFLEGNPDFGMIHGYTELIDEESDDMAAANTPAMSRPVRPAGSCSTMKSAKISSGRSNVLPP